MAEKFDASIMVQNAGHGEGHKTMKVNSHVPSLPKPRPAVVWWAWIGGAWLVFWAYVLTRWVTGPYFTPVPTGAVPPPTWMHVLFIVLQCIGPVFIVLMSYFFVIKP